MLKTSTLTATKLRKRTPQPEDYPPRLKQTLLLGWVASAIFVAGLLLFLLADCFNIIAVYPIHSSRLIFLFANIILISSGFLGGITIFPNSIVDAVLAILSLMFLQIVSCFFFCGILFHDLYPTTLLTLDLVFFAVYLMIFFLRFQDIRRTTLLRSIKMYIPEIFSSKLNIFLFMLVLITILWNALIAVFIPSSDFDAMWYHLPAAASWIKMGYIGDNGLTVWANIYPFNGEIVYSWLMIFTHSTAFVRLGQFGFAFMGGIATTKISRIFGMDAITSFQSGLLFLLTPLVIAQMASNYNDLIAAGILLATLAWMCTYYASASPIHLLMAGICGALAMGSKGSELTSVIVIFCTVIAISLIIHKKGILSAAAAIASFGIPASLFSIYWYLRTWISYGNPIFPFSLLIGKITIFPGLETVNQLAIQSTTPASLQGLPSIIQLLISWFSEPQIRYSYTQVPGGFGLQWPYLELPALIIVGTMACTQKKIFFWVFLLPATIILALQPGSFFLRYSLFYCATGAICLSYIVSKASQKRRLQYVIVAAICITCTVSAGSSAAQINYSPQLLLRSLRLPASERTYGNLMNPEFKWLDSIPTGSHIAVPVYENHFQTFPLFGNNLQFQVYGLQNTTILQEKNISYPQYINDADTMSLDQFLAEIQKDNINYVFLSKGSPFCNLVSQRSQLFVLIDSTKTNMVYKVVH